MFIRFVLPMYAIFLAYTIEISPLSGVVLGLENELGFSHTYVIMLLIASGFLLALFHRGRLWSTVLFGAPIFGYLAGGYFYVASQNIWQPAAHFLLIFIAVTIIAIEEDAQAKRDINNIVTVYKEQSSG